MLRLGLGVRIRVWYLLSSLVSSFLSSLLFYLISLIFFLSFYFLPLTSSFIFLFASYFFFLFVSLIFQLILCSSASLLRAERLDPLIHPSIEVCVWVWCRIWFVFAAMFLSSPIGGIMPIWIIVVIMDYSSTSVRGLV